MALILLIDDDDLVRITLSLLLKREGHEVLEAGGGEEALSICQSQVPDIAITDILMPGMDGLVTIQRLRNIAPQLKILALSGGGRNADQDVLKSASKLGADKVLTKPFVQKDFLASIEDLLKAAQGEMK